MSYSIICWVMIAKQLLKIMSFLPLTQLSNIANLKRNAQQKAIYTSQIGKKTMGVYVGTRIGHQLIVFQHVHYLALARGVL